MGSNTLVNGYHEGLVRNDDSSRKWVVQKFGGTSVGKFADKIVEGIVRYVQIYENARLKPTRLTNIASQTQSPRASPCSSMLCAK